jgi:hypothetical protein
MLQYIPPRTYRNMMLQCGNSNNREVKVIVIIAEVIIVILIFEVGACLIEYMGRAIFNIYLDRLTMRRFRSELVNVIIYSRASSYIRTCICFWQGGSRGLRTCMFFVREGNCTWETR